MEPIDASETSPTSAPISGQVDKKHQVQQSIQANREHQAALKSYTEKLESELEALDKLLVRQPKKSHFDGETKMAYS